VSEAPQNKRRPEAARAREKASSQVLFRDANEEIFAIADRFVIEKDLALLCECENGCLEPLSVSRGSYESIRRFPTRFVLKRGHTAPDERIVEEYASYVVIEKVGPDAAQTAIQLDPRRKAARPGARVE
jgi:hypothetical protein